MRRLTFDELLADVCRLAGALRRMGVQRGDTVGIFMPMLPETAVALLAIGRIGAIAVPAFSGYGAPALATRLADAGAKVLLTADGVFRRGKPVDMKAVADAALEQVPSVRARAGLRAHPREDRLGRGSRRRLVQRGRARGAVHRSGADGFGRAVSVALHVGLDGQTQRRRARPRRLSGQSADRSVSLLRRQAWRSHAVVLRHGLDDGPVPGARRARPRRELRVVTKARPIIQGRTACGKWWRATA